MYLKERIELPVNSFSCQGKLFKLLGRIWFVGDMGIYVLAVLVGE